MLPDFPKAKSRFYRCLLQLASASQSASAGLLKGVPAFRQHEGESGTMIRPDSTQYTIKFRVESHEAALSRDELKRLDLPRIFQVLIELATQMNDAQEKHLIEAAMEAATSVGNVTHAGGEFTQSTYFEVIRRIQLDFDPQTLQPKTSQVMAIHPNAAPAIESKLTEWEKDPAFRQELERILRLKREEWCDRENCRKLVD